jgi:alcohol dehydrogenase
MIEFFEYQLRTRLLFKSGLVREMADEIGQLGVRRVMIVADPGVVAAGLAERVAESVRAVSEVAAIFSEVPSDSSVATVEHGTAVAREAGADAIIAVGGGSALDTAKGIRILLTEGGTLYDYQGANLLNRPLTPMIAIPTTAGTGSEVTPVAVIKDEASQTKLFFYSPFIAPDMAVLDPEMTRTLPPRLTAATGMDALSHAIETFVGIGANPITDSLALQAIDMISNNLRAAVHSGDDLEARGQMLVAAAIAGIAFSTTGVGVNVGIVHAVSHTVGALHHVHHGTANSIVLPHGMRFNSAVVPNRYVRIARAMGVNAGGRPEGEVIEDGIAAVEQLALDCGLPARLRDVGVPEDALPAVADGTLMDGTMLSNPRPAEFEDALAVVRACW